MSAAAHPQHDPDSEIDSFGRVGYGRLARYSPVILGIVIVAAIVYIALNQDDDGPPTRSLIGQLAPELTLIPFGGGEPYALTSLRGDVVVLNFWASWCKPCRDEMPVFDLVQRSSPDDVRIIGVNIKNDRIEDAKALVDELDISYQLVRDTGGDHPVYGVIELALGGDGQYPVSVFIRPDGVIDAVRIGEMNEAEIRERIADAGD